MGLSSTSRPASPAEASSSATRPPPEEPTMAARVTPSAASTLATSSAWL